MRNYFQELKKEEYKRDNIPVSQFAPMMVCNSIKSKIIEERANFE